MTLFTWTRSRLHFIYRDPTFLHGGPWENHKSKHQGDCGKKKNSPERNLEHNHFKNQSSVVDKGELWRTFSHLPHVPMDCTPTNVNTSASDTQCSAELCAELCARLLSTLVFEAVALRYIQPLCLRPKHTSHRRPAITFVYHNQSLTYFNQSSCIIGNRWMDLVWKVLWKFLTFGRFLIRTIIIIH